MSHRLAVDDLNGIPTEAAVQRDMIPHVLDGTNLTSKKLALEAISTLLSFPDWAGPNYDACYDCLVTFTWQPQGDHLLIWSKSHVLEEHDPQAFKMIKTVLSDAAVSPTRGGRRFDAVYTAD